MIGRIVLASAAMLAAGSVGGEVEAVPRASVLSSGAYEARQGDRSGICAGGWLRGIVRINGASRYSPRRGLPDPFCRYKCTYCGPIKRCATVCR